MSDKIDQALLKAHSTPLFQHGTFTKVKDITSMKPNDCYLPSELESKRIIHPRMQDKTVLNYFRELRAKFSDKMDGKVTLVTSATPGGGSSFTSLNLASVIAFDHSRTALLIDADVNDGVISEILDVNDKTPGLTEYLTSEDQSIEHIIVNTGINRLRMISAGVMHDIGTEYFTGNRIRGLLNEVRNRYKDRAVIIDSPCILKSADTRMLAEHCDQVLLVVGYGKTTKVDVDDAISAIDKDKLLGLVINRIY